MSADAAAMSAPADMPDRELRIVIIAVMTGMFLGAIDGTIVSTALPTIVGDLGGQSQAPWISTGFLLAQTVATPIVGKLSDIYGRKITFQTSIVAFLLTSLLCGVAQSMLQLVAYRALQGIASAGLLTLPFSIMGDLMAPAQRARNQGYASATFLFAALFGPLLGGFIVDLTSWRWVFLINLPVGAIALVAVHRYLFISRRPTRSSIDVAGTVALTVATGPLIVALLWSGKEHGWGAPITVGMFVVSAVGAVVFIVVERRAAEPVMPLGLFQDPVVRATMIAAAISGIGLYALNSYAPVFLQIVKGTTATASGLLSIPTMVLVTLASMVSGKLIARTGNYKPFPIAGGVFLIAGAVLLSTMDADTSTASVSARAAVTGLGMGLIGPSLNLIVQNAVRWEQLGVATSGLAFVRSLGGVLGTAVLGAVYSNRLDVLIPRHVGADTADRIGLDVLEGRPGDIRALAEPARSNVLDAYAEAITQTVRWAIPVMVVALVMLALIPAIPLRDTRQPSLDQP